MSLRSRITTGMDGALSTFYRGPIRALVQATGLNVYLRRIYWWAILTIADPKKVRIGNIEAEFRVSTRQEYDRLKTLKGERTVLESFLAEVRPDDVIYDIGANIGTYACHIGKALSTGRVLAFEPHPETADRLEENVSLNQVDVRVYRYALSDTRGNVEFVPAEDELGAGEHALATTGKEVAGTISVETIPGDRLIAEAGLPRPNVVKIDVEGAELDVIKGLSESLASQSCRLVYCEVHPEKLEDFDGDPSAVRRALVDAGFEVERLETRGDEYFLCARR